MYRIIHPMNNNVALAKHENGEEVVLIGSGIAFNKKKGDIVVESKIEKILWPCSKMFHWTLSQ